MGVVIFVAVVLCALLAAAFSRMLRPRITLQPEWFENFTVDIYRPMERLLNEDDFHFLAGQPGYCPALGRSLRHERRRVLRQYLRSLKRDFNRLVHVARVMIVYSTADETEFQMALWKARLGFMVTMWRVQLSISMHTVGLTRAGLASVNVEPLVAALRHMHQHVDRLVPHPAE